MAPHRARLIWPTARGRTELARAGAHLTALHQRWEHDLAEADGPTVAEVVAALDALIQICEDTSNRAASDRDAEGLDR